MKVGTFQKQPGEKISTSINYEDALDDGDSIASIVSCVVSPSNELTVTATLASATRVRIWSEGGTDGIAYKITVTTTTQGGERFEDELTCKVKEL
jgi:hypothetical protein